MSICRDLIEYSNPVTGQTVKHHILYSEDNERYLLSQANIYLHDTARHALNTSKRYSSALMRFFEFLLLNEKEASSSDCDFYLHADNDSLRAWQVQRIIERNSLGKDFPSEKTVYDEAVLVSDFYHWLEQNDYPTSINVATKKWVANFKESDLLAYIAKKSKTVKDSKQFKVVKKRHQKSELNSFLTIEQIKEALSLYSDPVYAALFKLCMATGLRPSGAVQFPYVGFGENSHISSWENMHQEYKDKTYFNFFVVEKSKARKLKVNVNCFSSIYTAYKPELEKRRNLYKLNKGAEPPLSAFWFTDKGEIVTEAKIANATNYMAKKLSFDFTFYDSRHWYATMFMLEHLKNTNNDTSYNAAVEQALIEQIGHSSIKTTYEFYIKKALLYLHVINNPEMSDLVTTKGFLSLLDG